MDAKPIILIVDDNNGICETLKDILTEINYEVAVAKDGYKAIELVGIRTYDVALLDIKMPGINGVETFIKLKRIVPAIKVIMMTAYAMEDLIKEALENGAICVLQKPIIIQKLINCLKLAL